MYLTTARIGVDAQLDLLVDYDNNIAQYAHLHAWFRRSHRPLLAIWGKNDPFFLPHGADALKRDLPGAEARFLDPAHVALETHGAKIAAATLVFLERNSAALR